MSDNTSSNNNNTASSNTNANRNSSLDIGELMSALSIHVPQPYNPPPRARTPPTPIREPPHDLNRIDRPYMEEYRELALLEYDTPQPSRRTRAPHTPRTGDFFFSDTALSAFNRTIRSVISPDASRVEIALHARYSTLYRDHMARFRQELDALLEFPISQAVVDIARRSMVWRDYWAGEYITALDLLWAEEDLSQARSRRERRDAMRGAVRELLTHYDAQQEVHEGEQWEVDMHGNYVLDEQGQRVPFRLLRQDTLGPDAAYIPQPLQRRDAFSFPTELSPLELPPLMPFLDVPRVPVGSRIPTRNYTLPVSVPAEDAECGICLETPTVTQGFVRPRSCAHIFHLDCLDEWINTGAPNSIRCPLCREQICNQRREMRADANELAGRVSTNRA
ncbi:hypothetical protein BU26DRAFT_152247 [Trematosphaeria pertusa]|uniref:RING-type domain-containing protein n=1 Tax=Trematosphaeria pertusa TaxID=390896 RepID=A0A6A6IZ74_9PLEO|nr:uncharacterized protein BU26DRAFT_152247 [Trematosphaeria pertusa]KAF2255212.1 hypothetical protein BU26DRAFT_152247 [Trematosphaeria pertusa]